MKSQFHFKTSEEANEVSQMNIWNLAPNVTPNFSKFAHGSLFWTYKCDASTRQGMFHWLSCTAIMIQKIRKQIAVRILLQFVLSSMQPLTVPTQTKFTQHMCNWTEFNQQVKI